MSSTQDMSPAAKQPNYYYTAKVSYKSEIQGVIRNHSANPSCRRKKFTLFRQTYS